MPMDCAPVTFKISPEPISSETGAFLAGEGAEVQFLGVVRGEEKGQVIRGIDYSAYLPMAERMLRELTEQGAAEKGAHRVFIQHRLGYVAAEEPSIIIRVQTRHSAEAFDLCRWYLQEIKTRVPIWKQIVFP
jgi:molybdopterin synthase catalytic subunit